MQTLIICLTIALVFWLIGRTESELDKKRLANENSLLKDTIAELKSEIIVMRSAQ